MRLGGEVFTATLASKAITDLASNVTPGGEDRNHPAREKGRAGGAGAGVGGAQAGGPVTAAGSSPSAGGAARGGPVPPADEGTARRP